jgi:dipeptidyl aminopeptidase/acylaminoacyl peptidase
MHSGRRRLTLLGVTTVLAVTGGGAQLLAQTSVSYQMPPKALVELVDTKPTPSVEVSPPDALGRKWMLIEYSSGLATIAELAQPELRLAGLRFNPKSNGPSRGRYVTAFGLQALPTGTETQVSGLPANARMHLIGWAPDGQHFAFANVSEAVDEGALSLWIADVAGAQARQIAHIALNGIFGSPCEWMPDSRGLVCLTLLDTRGAAPQRSEVPAGPVVQENLGRVTPGPTYEDLLKSPEDEHTFDYYASSQVRLVHLDGTTTAIGKPGVISSASPSPDGKYVLIDERHHPYSYVLPLDKFPQRVSVVNISTGALKRLADKPLEDTVPNIHDAVETGPRHFVWRSDAPATLCWVAAADGGDPRTQASVRDTLFLLDAPFDAAPRKLADLQLRLQDITWSSNRLALIEETRWTDRKRIILAVSPVASTPPVKWFEGSFEDRYHDPGTPFTVTNPAGKPVAQMSPDAASVYFHSLGATADGDTPFVATMSVAHGVARQIWRSAPPYYESAVAVIDAKGPTLLVERESAEQSPNFYLTNPPDGPWQQVTSFPNPFGTAPLPTKQLLKYKRADGVDLSANLYLPPGYQAQDGPLPTLLYAYPTEYKTKDAAGQISGSPYRFPLMSWGSPVPFAAVGYAVLQNATIPIVGEGKVEPNDTYVAQLVASAKAAIDEGVRLGVVDRNRVAVMGHSYGAFMTVNLLAHTDFFKAGIARSGAYNRTLTPFGFQNEDRTYWEAPQVYYQMSPFSYADKIKAPLLLIHGEADNNTGTFPIQSERLFSAIKGLGGTVRFVLLPLESHGYAARESVLHMLWEMNNWLTTYVKNAQPAAKTGNVAASN